MLYISIAAIAALKDGSTNKNGKPIAYHIDNFSHCRPLLRSL
ncbi:hypothetical protein GAGA_0282 [Paraglaciecola agarilytica NO2]|uniref:Transposase n=1 Tax=Paraglaciecola agarilytica NO2 TaxID=1125747 RepID=A0ABQ0I1G9_9ALTE|nr:hypothetical protein GAGA_0282 [Paraglaciecola agarilytica NO2]